MAILSSKLGDTRIDLSFSNFQFPGSNDTNDKEWIVGDLNFNNSGFKAQILNQPQFYLLEIKGLISNLEHILKSGSGSTTYIGTEPYLTLEISLLITGVAIVKGKIWDVDHNSGKIEFEFESDQTCLSSFKSDLENNLNSL